MGILIFNLIGAFLLTIFLLGAYFERVALKRFVESLESLPFFAHMTIAIIYSVIIAVVATSIGQSFPPLHLLNTFLFYLIHFFPHEGGHVYFSFFGRTMHVMGGTLTELLLPCLMLLWSIKKKLRVASSLALFWLGYNLYYISEYIADARAMRMPAVGEFTPDMHDWHYLLEKLSMLEYDIFLSRGVGFLAYLVWVFAIVAVVFRRLFSRTQI